MKNNLIISLIIMSLLHITAIQSQGSAEKKSLFDLPLSELLNITVATMTEIPMQEAPSIVSVITETEIKNMGARDLWDILSTVPGISMKRLPNNLFHEIDFRGIENAFTSKVKVLINDQPIMGLVIGGSLWHIVSQIPINNIKRIEIIRGPGSALYGASAFTGVIKIITKEGGHGPSRVAVRSGSDSTNSQFAEYSYKNDNDLKVYFYAENYDSDGYDDTIESDFASDDSAPTWGPPPGNPVFAGKCTRRSDQWR